MKGEKQEFTFNEPQEMKIFNDNSNKKIHFNQENDGNNLWNVHTQEGLITETTNLEKNIPPAEYYEFINSANPNFLYTPFFKFMRDTEMAKGSEYSATTYMVMSTIF